MSTPLGLIAHGYFTSAGTKKSISLPKRPNYFVATNITKWGTASAFVIEASWFDTMVGGEAKLMAEDGVGVLVSGRVVAGADGFWFYDLSSQTPGAERVATAVTQDNPAIVNTAATPMEGDIVRMYRTTNMFQIAGMDFTVGTVVDGVSFELANLDSTGFGAPATGATRFRVIPAPYYDPYVRTITAITLGVQAEIFFSVDHNYQVGDKLRIRVPAVFGMTQMDGLIATVVNVPGADSIITNINSAAFTAFAFPTSAIAAAGITFAQAVPFGDSPALTSVLLNQSAYVMEMGTGCVGGNGDVIHWMAYGADYDIVG